MNLKHDKEHVIKIGVRLFNLKGYNNVGLDEICKTTGMTKGAFYNAFGSKENFLIETIRCFEKSNTQRILAQLVPQKSVKAITRLKNFYFTMIENQPKVNYMGCMVNNMMSELGANNSNIGVLTNNAFNQFVKAIEPTLKQAQKDGDINEMFDAEEITILLHSTFYGVLTRAKSLGDPKKGIATMKVLFKNLK